MLCAPICLPLQSGVPLALAGRVTTMPCLPRAFFVLALKIMYPGEPSVPGEAEWSVSLWPSLALLCVPCTAQHWTWPVGALGDSRSNKRGTRWLYPFVSQPFYHLRGPDPWSHLVNPSLPQPWPTGPRRQHGALPASEVPPGSCLEGHDDVCDLQVPLLFQLGQDPCPEEDLALSHTVEVGVQF